jgi:hypothetical protein
MAPDIERPNATKKAMCNNINNAPIVSTKEGERVMKQQAKAERKARARANHLNATIMEMIEREVIKPTPNVSLIEGLVSELIPGTMPGRLLDAISTEYTNAKRVANYNSEKLESIMNELRPMSQSFTNKLAEAMSLVESLSNAPHFAYNCPVAEFPYTAERARYAAMQDGDFLSNFEAALDAFEASSIGQRPEILKAIGRLRNLYQKEMGYTSNATNEDAGSYATERPYKGTHEAISPEEIGRRVKEAFSKSAPSFEKFSRAVVEAAREMQKTAPELMELMERMKPRPPFRTGGIESGGPEFVLRPWCGQFPANVSRIVGPLYWGKNGPAVEVKETQPGFVHGTRPDAKGIVYWQRLLKDAPSQIERERVWELMPEEFRQYGENPAQYWEINFGPFAAHAKKLREGEALTGEELYFIMKNRNTKYFEAISNEMLAFGADKFGL